MSNRKLYQTLLKQEKTIVFAESMTGGGLAAGLIEVPGASKVINESYVTYSIEAKERILDVAPGYIKRYGEVSAKVAEMMNEGLKEIAEADVYVSITGNAGPTFKTSFFNKPQVAYVFMETKEVRRVFEIILTSRSRRKNIKIAINETFNQVAKILQRT